MTGATPTLGDGVRIDPETGVVLADSVTRLEAATKHIVVTGSHGGLYAASLVAACGAAAAIFNDASRGLDDAGINGLTLLEQRGIPAAAVSHLSAFVGTAESTLNDGVISHVNKVADACGCRVGHAARDALRHLRKAAAGGGGGSNYGEARHPIRQDGAGPAVWALDSVSLVADGDAGAILVTGSHGALLGGRPATALKRPALAAIYNDAGGGPADRGRTRLPALDARGIAAATVYAATARIGDGRSTYDTGIVSAVNETARALGGRTGSTCRELVERLVERLSEREE